jgi:hypothetical protein
MPATIGAILGEEDFLMTVMPVAIARKVLEEADEDKVPADKEVVIDVVKVDESLEVVSGGIGVTTGTERLDATVSNRVERTCEDLH